jgi:Flp pilus assembly protein TadG
MPTQPGPVGLGQNVAQNMLTEACRSPDLDDAMLHGTHLMTRCANRRLRVAAHRTATSCGRRGAAALELILALPIWLIALLALIEFGQILSNQQQLALASRVGAEEASQTPGLDLAGSVPLNVLVAVNQQLASSGISGCKVILEHNIASPSPVTLSDGTCDCDPPVTPLPPRRDYVRVTVCVPLAELAPNLLSMFGFDISECIAQHSTTFRYELGSGL